MTTELCGLKVNGKIRAPFPFKGEATIVGFRYYTGRHNGRTSMVADYITDDGKAGFDAIEKLIPLIIGAPVHPAPEGATLPRYSHKDNCKELADAFSKIARQAAIISEVLGRDDVLNESVPKNWPLNLSADEFASACLDMREHYDLIGTYWRDDKDAY